MAGHASLIATWRKPGRHHRGKRKPITRRVSSEPPVLELAIPAWSGSSLGPTAAAADLGAPDFEQTLSDPTGMIARDVRRAARTWQATVAAQDGVTDARVGGLAPGDRLAAVRPIVGSERSWLELRAPSGRRTWVASERTRR